MSSDHLVVARDILLPPGSFGRGAGGKVRPWSLQVQAVFVVLGGVGIPSKGEPDGGDDTCHRNVDCHRHPAVENAQQQGKHERGNRPTDNAGEGIGK